VTYRLCVEAADVPVSCSAARPVATPAAADVTGDGVPDLVADLVPTAAPQDSAVGLGFAVRRLPRSGGEAPGGLRARVWAEYAGRVAVGFDGLRDGSSLSRADRGTFTVDLSGRRMRAKVRRTGPGPAAAVMAGLVGRSAVSLRQRPATERLTVDAVLDGPTLDVTASAPARVEAVAVKDGRYARAVLDRMPTRAHVELARGPGDAARVRFAGPGGIARAELRAYAYRDGRLARAVSIQARRVPPSLTAAYDPRDGRQALTLRAGSSRAGSARLLYYDRAAAGTVMRADLEGLPRRARLAHDAAHDRVAYTSDAPIGRLALTLQRGAGAISSPRTGHLTVIRKGEALGVSALLTGLSGFDMEYGARPHARVEARASARPFAVAGSADGVHLARLELSNTPATADLTVDPAAGQAAYRVGGAIDVVRAAYTSLASGLTIDGTVRGVRGRVTASWRPGERSSLQVAASVPPRGLRLYAAPAHAGARGGGTGGEELRVEVEGLPSRAELVADIAAGTLTWTASGRVASVSALARVRHGGRHVRAAARVSGVPARFDAAWGPSAYRFRGLSGPIGTAALAVTNHDGALAPAGPHLAAHHDASTGDLDASVLVKGLSRLELVPAAAGFTADLRARRQTLALDADVTLGDVRYGLLGRAGPLPGRLAVSADGGTLTYTGSRLDVRARTWLGKRAALRGMSPAPAVAGGVSLVDGGCVAGTPGCAPGPFCAGERGCFGLQGYLDVDGLPERITVDAARKTFAFSGYRPARRVLDVYLASTVLAPVPIKARAVLTGLPRRVTGMSLGPFETGPGSAVRAAYRVEPAATLGSLTVHAEGGGVRGQVVVEPVPATLAVEGAYGARTRVRVRNSTAVERLVAKVTVPGRGSGELRLADVPAVFGVDADAAAGELRAPALTYRAEGGENTLDGSLAVQGRLADPAGRLGDVSLAVTDLAADTTVRLGPGGTLDLASKPVPTRRIELHAALAVGPVARQRLSAAKDVPYTTGFLSYHVGGDFALGPSSVEDLSLTVRRLSWLRVRPGRAPFGMKAPAALGYLTPGFEGDYGRLDLGARGVDLRPDVRLDVRLSRGIGEDVFRESLRLGPATSLALRRYDQRIRRIGARQQISAGGVRLACLTVAAKPGFAAAQTRGSITLRGSDGPQMVSLLDPGGQAPDYAVDLITHFMSPFPGAGWQVSGATTGRCPGAPRH
jgi:hypothetical protein